MRRLLALLLLLTLPVWAQEPEKTPDQPDQQEQTEESKVGTDTPSISTSSSTVGDGVLQWESNFYYSSGKPNSTPRTRSGRTVIENRNPSKRPVSADARLEGSSIKKIKGGDNKKTTVTNTTTVTVNEAQADLYTTPQLLRYGIGDDFELRLETNGLAFQGRQQGVDDPALGFKWNLYKDDNVSFGVTAVATVPAGTSNFRSLLMLPQAVAALDYTLGEHDTLTVNAGAVLQDALPNAFFSFLGTVAEQHEFNDTLSGYLETAVLGPTDKASGPYETVVDGGLAVYMTKDWVLNLAVFKGLSSTGTDWGASIGFGARL